MFENAALVVAHPDDEAFGLGSILERVDDIIICFMDIESRPDWRRGRRRWQYVYHWGKAHSCVKRNRKSLRGLIGWPPVLTDYGLEVSKRKDSFPGFSANGTRTTTWSWDNSYGLDCNIAEMFLRIIHGGTTDTRSMCRFFVLSRSCSAISASISGSRTIGSNKSHNLMLQYISGFDSSYVTIECNRELGKSLMLLYKRNNCWTWFENYTWFTQECFYVIKKRRGNKNNKGHIFPLNFIKVHFQQDIENTMKLNAIAKTIVRRLRNQALFSIGWNCYHCSKQQHINEKLIKNIFNRFGVEIRNIPLDNNREVDKVYRWNLKTVFKGICFIVS